MTVALAFAASAALLGLAECALAQQRGQGSAASASAGRVWSAEYWANKGEVRLYMYRKRMTAPQPGQAPLPVLFLVHGSSISSRPSFDLTVPGRGDYSLMDKFAGYGYDVWTMDFEGYGRSSRTSGNSDIASGVQDLAAAVEVVARETGQQRYHFFGSSSGALRAGAFAAAYPARVNRIILSALTYTGEGSSTLTDRARQVEFYRANNRRPRDREMIRSIYTRDMPGTSDPAVADAQADAELVFGDSVPTGTYLDMTTKLPVVDPKKVLCPVLIVRGEHDGIADEQDILNFFKALPNFDRQVVALSDTAHTVHLGHNRHQLWHVMKSFLEMPPKHGATAAR
jgi:alpha-beta hydrolase superfamily lysophospholipase